MADSLAPLYPYEVQQFKVIEHVSISGYPPDFVQARQELHTRYLGELSISQDGATERLVFVNKLKPHSLHDIMILVADDDCKASVTDLTEATVAATLKIAHGFLDFVGEADTIRRFDLHNGHFHFCYNYDFHTRDRESGMSDRRFHIHLNYFSGKELSPCKPCPFGNLPSVSLKHRLLDPITVLGGQIAYDFLREPLADWHLLPPDPGRDLRLGLPAGFKIQFSDWSILNDPSLARILRLVHDRLEMAYSLIARAFTGTDRSPQAWHRHPLLPSPEIIHNIKGIQCLSENSQQGLVFLANTLRDISPRVMEYLRKRKWARVRHLTSAGLYYALGLYSQEANQIQRPILGCRPVYLVVQPKLFADMGGAGVAYLGDISVARILRGDGILTPEQILQRAEFQSTFVERARELLRDDHRPLAIGVVEPAQKA